MPAVEDATPALPAAWEAVPITPAQAAFSGDADVLKGLLEAGGAGAAVTADPVTGMTPLMLAALKGHVSCAAQLIDGAVPDDGKQPRPERSPGLIGMPGLVQSQQALLNTVVQILQAAEAADEIAPDSARELAEELPVGFLITRLSACQPA